MVGSHGGAGLPPEDPPDEPVPDELPADVELELELELEEELLAELLEVELVPEDELELAPLELPAIPLFELPPEVELLEVELDEFGDVEHASPLSTSPSHRPLRTRPSVVGATLPERSKLCLLNLC